MQPFQLPFTVPPPAQPMLHREAVLLLGSCFTEHIGSRMEEGKMQVMANPHGILFNPLSMAASLQAYLDRKSYTSSDVFYLNETWNSWDFHSRFSHTDQEQALSGMNESVARAAAFLQEAKWLVLTFGSAYQYFTTASGGAEGYGVANCHKAPGQWFEKKLLSLEVLQEKWLLLIAALHRFNPALRILFTVSPVRHTRDGLAENNRSKARLIELVHFLVAATDQCFYFPAYEIVVDVLRDYRFFEQDMVHPNNLAAQYVWEQFVHAYMNEESRELLQRLKEITTAMRHRPRFPQTVSAGKFKESLLAKTMALKAQFPYLNLQQELQFFAPGR